MAGFDVNDPRTKVTRVELQDKHVTSGTEYGLAYFVKGNSAARTNSPTTAAFVKLNKTGQDSFEAVEPNGSVHKFVITAESVAYAANSKGFTQSSGNSDSGKMQKAEEDARKDRKKHKEKSGCGPCSCFTSSSQSISDSLSGSFEGAISCSLCEMLSSGF